MAPKTQKAKANGWKTNVRNLTDTTFTNVAKSEPVLRRIVLGEFGNLRGLSKLNERVLEREFWAKAVFLLVVASLLSALVWLYVDINRTSAHAFYRDRLSRAFLFDVDSDGQVSPAFDYSNGSVAPST